MADTYSRTDVQRPPAPRERIDDIGRVVTLEPAAPAYTCSVCTSDWDYQDVRNTGRCPSCGSGLLRSASLV